MNIVEYPLKPKTYVPSCTVKTNIVLHSSFSRTKYTFTKDQKDETCLMQNWNVMADKFAGHYVVCRNGTIYSCVHEEFWTYHVAADKKFSEANKKSLGIFIANERYLEKENNKFYAFGFSKPYNMYTGKVFEFPYKGYHYWADYDTAQIDALCDLLKHIAARNEIPLTMLKNTTQIDYNAFEKAGIVSCANINRDSRSLPLPDWAIQHISARGIALV